MAGIAFGLAMFAFQQVFRLFIVIEGAGLPILGGMAGRALFPIAPLVSLLVIVLSMTGHTLHFDLQLGIGATHSSLVATLALGILVLFAQREFRVVMIEIRILPTSLVMAALAFLAQAAAMPFFLVVFLVAGNALGGQLLGLIKQALFRQVTGIALGLAMFALQGVMGVLVMVKIDFFPALVVVAGLALGAITPLVPLFLVDLLVTTIAGQRGLLIGLVGVTLLTLDLGMLATNQRKLGLFVIEARVCPLPFVMTVLALASQMPLVPLLLVVLLVALVTKLRCLPILELGLMTAFAFTVLVGAEQFEISLAVVEFLFVERRDIS